MAKLTVEVLQPPIKKVVLELTEDEAQHVWAMFGNIGGSGTYRPTVDKIYDQFQASGMTRKYFVSPFESTPMLSR